MELIKDLSKQIGSVRLSFADEKYIEDMKIFLPTVHHEAIIVDLLRYEE